VSELHSKNGRRLTVRFDDDFYGEVESYQNLHNLKTWVKALHVRDKENLQKIEELTSLKNKKDSIFDYIQKKGLSADTPLDKDMSISTSTELSEKACSFMVYVEQEKVCGNPDAPISAFLKRHLNVQICALCQKLKRIKENELQKKQDEDHEKALEKAKEETRKAVEQLNKPSRKRDDFAGQPRVNYDNACPNGAPVWVGDY